MYNLMATEGAGNVRHAFRFRISTDEGIEISLAMRETHPSNAEDNWAQ